MDARAKRLGDWHDYLGGVKFNGVRIRYSLSRKAIDGFGKDCVKIYFSESGLFSGVLNNSTDLSFFRVLYSEFE